MEAEVWKSIDGYEGIYEISSFGNVRSYARETVCLIKPRINQGYFILGLWNKGKCKTSKIHRLVALHFIENPDNKPQVNHIDGNKLNNHLDNLEWVTPQENSAHASKLKLVAYGTRNAAAKITDEDVVSIRKMYDSGEFTQNQLSNKFNLSQGIIGKIINGLLWEHVPYSGERSLERISCNQSNYTRNLRGDNNYWSKITESQVKEIREMYNNGDMTYKQIADLYGVTPQNIRSIIIRKTWKNLE